MKSWIPLFKENWLSLSDEQLGVHLLSCWIAHQAEKMQATSFNDIVEKSEMIVSDIARIDTDNIKNIPIEKALKLVASGNSSRGGALFREYLLGGAQDLNTQLLAKKGEKFRPARKIGSLTEKTKYIYKLSATNPNLSAKELYKISDMDILGSMSIGTFSNHVSKSKKINKSE